VVEGRRRRGPPSAVVERVEGGWTSWSGGRGFTGPLSSKEFAWVQRRVECGEIRLEWEGDGRSRGWASDDILQNRDVEWDLRDARRTFDGVDGFVGQLRDLGPEFLKVESDG
jgi:hypothetical protein